jgi:hypothetical protein
MARASGINQTAISHIRRAFSLARIVPKHSSYQKTRCSSTRCATSWDFI